MCFKDYLTPLHVAAHCGNVNAAKLLLDRHCDVNARALVSSSTSSYHCHHHCMNIVSGIAIRFITHNILDNEGADSSTILNIMIVFY